MIKTRKVPVRVFCEDTSQLLKKISSYKDHGKVKVINGVNYEVIGGDMLLNMKTNRIEKINKYKNENILKE
jgi:hypothetical protein